LIQFNHFLDNVFHSRYISYQTGPFRIHSKASGMNSKKPLHPLLACCAFLIFSTSLLLHSQTVTLQFMQTEYDIKELCFVDELIAYAVGDSHWDQSLKVFRSTILKSVDGGGTWNSLNVSSTEDLWDVHFMDAEEGWVAGESGLLLHTLDGGASWSRKDIGTDLDVKSLCFTDAFHGWVVANEVLLTDLAGDPDSWKGRIWHTSDGGDHWSEQVLPADAGLLHCIYFKNSEEGWALGVKNLNPGVFAETRCAAYHTLDGGATWIEKFSPDLHIVFTDMDFPETDTGYMAGFKTRTGESDGLFFRTYDGGENWERSSDENDVLWEIDFIDAQRGYALGADYYSAWGPPVYRTMDGGDTWDKIMMQDHANQGLYGLSVFEDKVVGLGDEGYMIRSGDPWGELPLPHEDQLFTCQLIDTLYHFEDVFFITPQKGWVVGQKSAGPDAWAQVIMHTLDGGESWSEQYSFYIDDTWAFAFRLNAVQFVSESTGWAVGEVQEFGSAITSGVLFTDDGGETWVQQAQGISEGEIVDLFFLDEQKGWALTNRNSYPEDHVRLLKTIDGGTHWEMVSTGQEGTVTIGFAIKTGSLLFQDEQRGWILGAQCDLLKTEDGGGSWTPVSLPEEWTNTFDIAFANDLQGTVCGEHNFISTDGGENWIEGMVHEKTLTDLCFTDTVHGWMVGEWGEIFYTLDGGASWVEADHESTQAAFKAVSFPDHAHGWAAGRGGTIVAIDPSALASAVSSDLSRPTPFLSQNHPNPFSTHTQIQFSMGKPGRIDLAVYDMNGRRIATLLKGIRGEGKHTMIWNGRDARGQKVGPGIYIYRLTTPEGTASRSMLAL